MDVIRVLSNVGQYLEVAGNLHFGHVLYKFLYHLLPIVRFASKLSKVIETDVSGFVDEETLPNILNKGVSVEAATSGCTIFPEDLHELYSLSVELVREDLIQGAWEKKS